MYMNKLAVILITFIFSVQAVAEDPVIAKLFDQQGVNGTIVISSLDGEQTFIHNKSRANHRFTAASTFKIMNTLISLEEKVVSGKNSVFKWDGHTYSIINWNQDQTLESAFKVSCVWCYQKLARKIGAEKYRSYLQKSNYGEFSDTFKETTFWLDGSLKISTIEQVEFLKKVYQQSLPFRKASYKTLQEIMIVEQNSNYTIRAKTGVAGDSKPKVGWYVGYVEVSGEVWFFALNLDIRDHKDIPLRIKLTQKALEAKQVLE